MGESESIEGVRMKDNYGRDINYLRISVTDLCNLRCKYCMPEEGIDKSLHRDIITVEETIELAKTFSELGIDKIRLTGGEPLVRKGILDIVKGIGRIDSIKDLSMTTNGILLKDYARGLKDYGLNRVNISLDTLDKEKFRDITRGGNIADVFESIRLCQEIGLKPIKINVVLMDGFNDDEIGDFINLTVDNDIDIRFIELMPIGEAIDIKDKYLSNEKILEEYSELKPVERMDKSSPADYFKVLNAKGRVGFINPISCKFCDDCNRVRLTSHGKLKLCLHSNDEYDLKELLEDRDNLKKNIEDLIYKKPEKHNLEEDEFVYKKMHEIGG